MGFWMIHVILLKTGLVPFIRPLAIVYAALIGGITCLLWFLRIPMPMPGYSPGLRLCVGSSAC